MSRDQIVVQLLRVFRQYGYEGATLTKISQATDLGRASLYHYFPGGKEDMANAVLEHLDRWRETNVLTPLRGEGTALERLEAMMRSLDQAYSGGQQSCLISVLSMGDAKDLFSPKIRVALEEWIGAIAEVLTETGVNPTLAKHRAEDAILQIQGALVLARALENTAPFQRLLQRLPKQLLHP
jgi:TetR/AcrR family transcriptional regulator, lmrAB and yxaGH operons repressor